MYATSLIIILGDPRGVDHNAPAGARTDACGIGIFDPALGGDPVLFEHLFWFYSHPAVYIMVLPGMGVISEIVPAFAQKRAVRLPLRGLCQLGLASLTFFVWGHHMFVNGQSETLGDRLLAAELRGRGAVRGQGVQLDRDDLQREHLGSRRRCSTRWAISACSWSAA